MEPRTDGLTFIAYPGFEPGTFGVAAAPLTNTMLGRLNGDWLIAIVVNVVRILSVHLVKLNT